MATYAELIQASQDAALRNKVTVACVIAANDIRVNGAATDAQKSWAKSTFENPSASGSQMLWPVLAQNTSATLAQITGATDAAIQNAVNAALVVFIA